MDDLTGLLDILIDNFKKILYPEDLIDIDLKFSKSELFALLLADRKTEVTMSELSEYINAPMSTSTGIVDRLVKKKLLIRDRSEEDRRIVTIRLTPDGEALIGRLKQYWLNISATILNNLSLEEKLVINKIVSHMSSLINTGTFANTVKLKDNQSQITGIHID
jgi:DNA-binding MarR family transcriptional regulator